MEEVTVKRNFGQRFSSYLNGLRKTPLPLVRTVLKASISVLISLILVLVDKTRLVIGPACTMATLGTLLYFPVKPVGIQSKRAFQGILSALVGAAWCYLGNFAANAARDPNVESPLQPGSSAVSAVFCVILMFVLRYVRAKHPQLDFATTFASMIGSFSLTQNASKAGFTPDLTFTYLKPILFSSAIALFVNIFIWPEDSVSNYLGTMNNTLKEFNLFFQRNASDFLGQNLIGEDKMNHFDTQNMSLAALKTQLQASFIKLIDAQHDVDYTLLHHELSHKQVSKITQLVKSMHTPLHGIGLSIICKQKEHSIINEDIDLKKDANVRSASMDAEFEKITIELVLSCKKVVEDCILYVSTNLKDSPRSTLSTFLWPFPRLFKKSIPKMGPIPLESLNALIAEFNNGMQKEITDISHITRVLKTGGSEEKRLQLLYLFRFNVAGYTKSIQSLAVYLNQLNEIPRKKLWFPQVPLKSWFKSSASSSPLMMGGQISERKSVAESIRNSESSFSESIQDGESGYSSYQDQIERNDSEYVCSMNRNDAPLPRDPDVDYPITASERFFSHISAIFDWFYTKETIFGLKAAVGFILLSLPAYLPQSAGWFIGWGGQWVANTLIMWIFPMAGSFNFTILLGLFGSVNGGVLSIIVYEIVRGNPYGIAVLSFPIFVVFHYIFFTSPVYSYMAIMTLYTYLMVITTGYQQAVGGDLTDNTIEVAAGKRMLFVILGILCSAIVNWFPRPVTGRVELRKSIARTFRDLSVMYGAIFANILDSNSKGPLSQVKEFRRLGLGVQRQLMEENTYLKLSKLEPPLKGKFPFNSYKELLIRLNNMADLIEGMAYSASALDKSWRLSLIQVLNEERFDYIACLLTVMRSLSSNLNTKMPLPPYMISPQDLKDKVDEKLCSAIQRHPEQVCNETFPGYCAYTMASARFTDELIAASKCVEKLVGVENPEKWLKLNASS